MKRRKSSRQFLLPSPPSLLDRRPGRAVEIQLTAVPLPLLRRQARGGSTRARGRGGDPRTLQRRRPSVLSLFAARRESTSAAPSFLPLRSQQLLLPRLAAVIGATDVENSEKKAPSRRRGWEGDRASGEFGFGRFGRAFVGEL